MTQTKAVADHAPSQWHRGTGFAGPLEPPPRGEASKTLRGGL
jgi:hypothetical protein